MLSAKEKEYLSLDEEQRTIYYYKERNRFNELKQMGVNINPLERATLMIFLNKTCYNGMYRVNKKGLFNVPQGYYSKPVICDEINLKEVSKRLGNVTIVCGDYHLSYDFIDNKTFVYVDPPYRPLTETSNFGAYTEHIFKDDDQIEIADFVKQISAKGAKVLVSNSDPSYADETDDFFHSIYRPFIITSVDAKRSINRNVNDRGRIKELLISNY